MENRLEKERKREREASLQWQSRLLVWLMMPLACLALLGAVVHFPTRATTEALLICAGFGLVVWSVRAATPAAALTGFVLTSCIYLGTVDQPAGKWFHTALLCGLALFLLAFGATRFRRAKKEQQEIAESRQGRGAAQVIANMGAAALLGSLAVALSSVSTRVLLSIGIAAALGEAATDTVSSEIGQAAGGTPRLLTSFKPVPPGTDGAVSVVGTISGLAAAAVITFIARITLGLQNGDAGIVWLACVLGFFVDSLLGATFERAGYLNNDIVNFTSTAVSALFAVILARFTHRVQ